MIVLTKMNEIPFDSVELFQTCSNGEILERILGLLLSSGIDWESNSN